LGATSNDKRGFGGMEKKAKVELGLGVWKLMLKHLEGEEWLDF